VGKWINPRDRKAKVGVKLIRDTQGIRLNTKAKKISIAIIGEARLNYGKCIKIGGCQCDFPELLGMRSYKAKNPMV